MSGVEVFHHQVEGGHLGFDLIASLQNQMCPRSEFENSKIVASDDGSHTQADHERVRVSQAVGRQADVTDPHRGSEIRIGQLRLHAAQRNGLQLQQTALTVNAEPQSPDARRLPNLGTSSCLLSAASPC